MSRRKRMVLSFTARFSGPTNELQALARTLSETAAQLATSKTMAYGVQVSITESLTEKAKRP